MTVIPLKQYQKVESIINQWKREVFNAYIGALKTHHCHVFCLLVSIDFLAVLCQNVVRFLSIWSYQMQLQKQATKN